MTSASKMELLQTQLDAVSLIMAMYSGQDELMMDARSLQILQILKSSLDNGEEPQFAQEKPELHLRLLSGVPDALDKSEQFYIGVSFPLNTLAAEAHDGQPSIRVTIEQPSWLSRRNHDRLVAGMPKESADLVQDTIEYLQTIGSELLVGTVLASPVNKDAESQPLIRVWFYFPSLSTREKRNDLVTLAPRYDLTGFVLAGKPGVLCLEGTSNSIQAYIADIKCNSWGDVPSFQKKITERIREEDDVAKKFDGMREITDEIERHGQRGNRGDLSQVERFLEHAGLGYAFGPVFMQKS